MHHFIPIFQSKLNNEYNQETIAKLIMKDTAEISCSIKVFVKNYVDKNQRKT